MFYVAKHYTRIAGRKYTPGEIIDGPIPAEKRARLLKIGAIEGMGGPESEAETESMDMPESDAMAESADMPESEAMAESADMPEGEAEAEAEDAPEIDAMDGIVSAGGTKKSGRGRRKAT